jgi:hypothetical protein
MDPPEDVPKAVLSACWFIVGEEVSVVCSMCHTHGVTSGISEARGRLSWASQLVVDAAATRSRYPHW